MKILVVDDEKLLVKGIKFNLENEGYQVLTAYDGASAVELARQETLGLIILDLMMPGLSGSEACMKIREFSDVPIIMLTARSEDADKIMGFACGADDYVTKPFNILELKARIRALLRRSSGQSRPAAQPDPELLTVGDLTLDTRQRVAIRDGKAIDLTAKEYDLVELLMKNPRRVYSRESLMDLVWGYSYAGDYRTVDVHIRRLREKLERVPADSDKKAVHKTCNHTTADCRKIIVFVAALSTFLCYNFCFYPFNFGCCCHRVSPFIFFQSQAALLCKIELYKISGSSQAPTSRAEAWQSCCN